MSLLIPIRRQATELSHPVSPSAVKQLIHSLHPIDTADQAQELYDGLKHSNRLDIPNHQRLEMASLFKPVTEQLTLNLAKHYKDHALPLPAASARAWHLVDALLLEMAFAYKIIVNDTYASLLPGQSKTRTNGIFHALQWLARRAEHHLMIYGTLPAGLLQDTNELYQLAEQSAIARQEFTDDTNSHRFDWTIERAYSYLQLLALSAPYKIRTRQIPLVFRWLHTSLEKVPVMTVLPDRQKNHSCFVIHAGQDIRPQSVMFSSGEIDKNTRFIDLSRLLGALEQAQNSAPQSLAPRLESDTLTQHTIQSLHESFKREHTRETARAVSHKAVAVESGLANLCTNMLFYETQATETGASETQATEIQTIETKPESTAAAHSGERVEFWPQLPEQRPGEWHLINESRLGIGLEWFNPMPARVEVGDVIGIKRFTRSRGHFWYIGLIQWIRSVSEQRLTMGVKFLTNQSRVGHITPDSTDTEDGTEVKKITVLMLTQPDPLGDILSLLAVPGTVNLHDSVTDDQGNRFYIQDKRRETALVEEFGLFRLQSDPS